jgi:hypothetical protein
LEKERKKKTRRLVQWVLVVLLARGPLTSGVIPTYLVVSIKNARFKCQSSTPMQAFASMRSTPFIKIDDERGEIIQRYESFGRD